MCIRDRYRVARAGTLAARRDRIKTFETAICLKKIMTGVQTHDGRVDWVDYAKGFCIIFVVMMHSTLGVEAASGQTGWLHGLVEFARPFRMPDFFMISGLFLAQVIDRDWRTYLDRKVVHFAYFYMLPIFFVVVKLARRVPVAAAWTIGAALEIAHISPGWTVIDEFAARFVYFYTGYILARQVFAFTARAQTQPWLALGLLVLWGLLNGTMVYAGYAPLPLVSLALGMIGAAAAAT